MTISGFGPRDAKIMLVGEAPSFDEEKEGKPFVGRAGRELTSLLQNAGIARDEVYITNACLERIVGDKKKFLFDKGQPSTVYLQGIAQLIRDIQEIKPNVVVPLGNYALWALRMHESIMKWRGSIIPSTLTGTKLVPTIHPAALLRGVDDSTGKTQGGMWKMRSAVILDLIRAKEQSAFPEIRLTPREHWINPLGDQADYAIARLEAAKEITFDIETFGGTSLACIGFSDGDPSWSVTWAYSDLVNVMVLFKHLLELPVPKVFQNGMYDITMLRQIGIKVACPFWDTMLASHVLIPDLPKGLDFLASIYTDLPYWKDEGKIWNKKGVKDYNQFYRYNGKDVCATAEIRQKQEKFLEEEGLMQVFRDEMGRIEPLAEATFFGMRIDTALLDKFRKEQEDRRDTSQAKLNEYAGKEVNVNSPPQMSALIFDDRKLGTPAQKRKRSTRADILADIHIKTEDPVLKLVVDVREARKLISNYYNRNILSADNRVRSIFNPAGTKFGRLSSSAPLWGPGTNLQNIPDKARRMMVADDGCVIVELDQSQAEAVIVAYLANDPIHMDCFRTGKDVHRVTACLLLDKPITLWQEIPKDAVIRYLAKKCNHGFNYEMGYVTFMYVVNGEYDDTDPKSVKIDRRTAEELRHKYIASRPALTGYWEWVRTQLRQNQMSLTTPLGRKYTWLDQWSDALCKEAYSFIPQSTVGDTTNLGIIRIFKDEECNKAGVKLLLNGHDSAVFQVPEEAVSEIAPRLMSLMETELYVNGYRIIVPIEGGYGKSWYKPDMQSLGITRTCVEI